MALTFKTNAGGDSFEPIPAGSHIAICDIVADLGIQPGSVAFPKPKQQVFIRFQLPQERIEFEKDGKKMSGPAVIGKIYTASMNEKANLRHHLESWRGKNFTDEQAEAFDVSLLLGKPCMLTVMQTQKDGKTYSNIAGIGPLPKGIGIHALILESNPLLYAAPDNLGTYSSLPEWIRKKIDGQIIQKPVDLSTTEPSSDDVEITDDDIPF